MLIIRNEQLKKLNRLAYERYFDRVSKEIEEKMYSRIPGHIKNIDKNKLDIKINESIRAADKYEIDDPEQLYDWCVIRIVTGQKFYQMDEFKYILEHRFLTPFAKTRHLIMIFFTILETQRKDGLCAQQ